MGFSRRLETPYYRKLHGLDFSQVQSDLKDYCLNHEDYKSVRLLENWWQIYPELSPDLLEKVPSLPKFFEQLGLTVGMFAFFQCNNRVSAIHVDQPDVPMHYIGNCRARINIPIMNCENSTTCFYTSTGEEIIREIPATSRGGKSADETLNAGYFDPSLCTKVDEFNLDVPTVFRVDVPHNVIVDGFKFPRIAATIGFYEDPTPLLESNELVRNLQGVSVST